jgi:hypothetical protein
MGLPAGHLTIGYHLPEGKKNKAIGWSTSHHWEVIKYQIDIARVHMTVTKTKIASSHLTRGYI